MPTRSTTSAYLPAPPTYNLGGSQNGRFSAGLLVKKVTSAAGVKPNMCCAPATNGERAFGKVTASAPASAKAMKGMRPRLSH